MGAAAIVVALLAALLTPASAQDVQQRQVGSWVMKWGQSRMGYYCTVETVQGGRTLGYQVVRDGRIFFGFKDPAWTWKPRSVHDAKLSVAGGADWTGRAVAALPEAMVLPIRPDPQLDPAKIMEAGRSLVFAVGGRTTTFDLAGFPEAARAQRACLATPT